MCNREMETPALDFTGTIAGKKKQPVVLDRSFCEVVREEWGGNGDDWQVKSDLLSVAGTRRSCLRLPFPAVERTTQLFLGRVLLAAASLRLSHLNAIRTGCLKRQVSTGVASTSGRHIMGPEDVDIGKAEFAWAALEPQTDRFLLHSGSAVVPCAVADWEQKHVCKHVALCLLTAWGIWRNPLRPSHMKQQPQIFFSPLFCPKPWPSDSYSVTQNELIPFLE